MKQFYALILIGFLTGCKSTDYTTILKPTVEAKANTYYDNREVDIEAWLSYYSWKLKNEGYNSAITVLPDSNAVEDNVWEFIKIKSTEFNHHISSLTGQPVGYFSNNCNDLIKTDKLLEGIAIDEPGLCPYYRFPVTGITYEQATEFCKWRTKIMGHGKVEFRLPTEDEWKAFALKGLSNEEKINGYRDSLYTNGCPMYNYKFLNPCNRFSENGLIVSRQIGVVRFMKEKNGAFDVFGNVSEMTNKKGVSKGGNYTTYAKQSHVDSIQFYDKPEVWLGFRCIGIKK